MLTFRFLFIVSVPFFLTPSFVTARDVFNPNRVKRFVPKRDRCTMEADCSSKVRNPGRCPLSSVVAPPKGFMKYLFLSTGSQCCRSDADCSINRKCCFSKHYRNLMCTEAKTVESSTTFTSLINGSGGFTPTGKCVMTLFQRLGSGQVYN